MRVKDKAAGIRVRYFSSVNDFQREAEKRGIRVTPTWNGITFAEAGKRTIEMIQADRGRNSAG